jgi:PAS domain S-box-containing protein
MGPGAAHDSGRAGRTVPPIDQDAQTTHDVLRGAVNEAAGLLRADGGLVYLVDATGTTLRLLVDVGVTDDDDVAGARRLRLSVGEGMFGRSVAERKVVVTGGYAADSTFRHVPDTDRVAAETGIQSMVVAPLTTGDEVLGAIAIFARRPDAFGDRDVALVRSLAAHAAATLANEALIAALGRTAEQLAGRSERERTLRELVGSLATARDPEHLLRRVLLAVATVSGARGALIDRIDVQGGHTHVVLTRTDKGVVAESSRDPDHRDWGVMGLAMEERRITTTADYMADERFLHSPGSDELAARLGVRSVVAAPLIADGELLGVLGGYSERVDAFDDEAVEMMAAFADHAAVAIANARRMEELHRSRSDLARRASEERALREIGATLAAIRNPDEVLEQAVGAACRMVGGEWAEIVRLEDNLKTTWTHVYGPVDPEIYRLQTGLQLRMGEGMLGRAAEQRRTVVTGDYLEDANFVHLPASDDFARTAGFRSLVAAPLIVGGAEVVGILAVHSTLPDAFDEGHVALVDSFANIAAAAMGNARLIEALDLSEGRFRDLLAALPDIVFEVDADGVFTYLSDTFERQLGTPIADLLGQHFSRVIDADSMANAGVHWQELQDSPGRVTDARYDLIHGDGRRLPFEVRSVGLAVDGRFVGAQGAARDVSERVRLERELMASERDLRDSEQKYRYLVDNSPDIVWSADSRGVVTYMSETCEPLLGWRPDEVIGQYFAMLVHSTSLEFMQQQVSASVAGAPAHEIRYRFNAKHRDGTKVPLEMHARTIVEDGVYLGSHGACRDLRERERLERDLRRHAAELAASDERAHLARELHDSVTQALFSMTLVTKSIEMLLDSDPSKARARLQTLAELQADALAEMRALIFELRPASLEAAGLVAALRTHCAALQGRTGLAIVLEAEDEDEGRLPSELEAALFRIAQEALNNVVKHAAAHSVRLAVSRNAGRAVLVVEDDRAGFDPGQVPDGHLGLAGMRARSEKLGGRLTVESIRGQGTTVRVELPLPLAAAASSPDTEAAILASKRS